MCDPNGENRPWYRLHASTYFFAWLTIAALFLLNFPGAYRLSFAYGSEKYSIAFVRDQEIVHGWPWIFVARGTGDGDIADLAARLRKCLTIREDE